MRHSGPDLAGGGADSAPVARPESLWWAQSSSRSRCHACLVELGREQLGANPRCVEYVVCADCVWVCI